jgi:hypothetical protein
MFLAVTVWSPQQVSTSIESWAGWQPVAEPPSPEADPQTAAIAESVSRERLYEHVRYLSTGPSRVTGYPGAHRAARYIEEEYIKAGLQQVSTESFSVPVPYDRGGSIELSGSRFPLHALWPNHVRAPSLPEAGIDGRLIDGGHGELEDFDGQPLDGSIVLLGFGSGTAYLRARMLGAAAIVFYDDGQVTRAEAAQKFLQVPADIPRYWIDATATDALRTAAAGEPVDVHLTSRMDWIDAEAQTIIGWLHGDDESMPIGQRQQEQSWGDQVILLHAYYDAISVVPAIAPGAESATGIAAQLELARLLQSQGIRYTVLFVATPGHFQGLAGVNDFLHRHARVSDHFNDKMPAEERIPFRLFVGLDLSSHSSTVGPFTMGTFYNSNWQTDHYQKNLMAHYADRFEQYTQQAFGDLSRYQDGIAPTQRTWKNYMPVRLALDSEAAIFVGHEALTMVTPNQLRARVDTPVDRLEFVDFDGLTTQVRTLAGLMYKATRDAEFFNDSKLILRDQGHSLEGHVYWFDRDVNFAVPKKPVPRAMVTYVQPGPNSVAGVRTLISTRTRSLEAADSLSVDGIGNGAQDAGWFRFDIIRNRFTNRIQAFELDTDGRIISAPDMGEEGNGTYPIDAGYGWWENKMLEVVFPCKALTFLEVVDPRFLSALDRIQVLGGNDAPPRSYSWSYIDNQNANSEHVVQAGVVFAEPGKPVKILAGSGLFGTGEALSSIRFMLTNADPDFYHDPVDPQDVELETINEAQGRGFPVDQGMIFHPSLQAARDMWIIDDVRMKQLERYGIVLGGLEVLHSQARDALQQAQQSLTTHDYSGYFEHVREALGLEARIYPDVRDTANDTVRAVIFYFALLLPFAFFCERFFFAASEVRNQIFGFVGIFVGVFLLLRWVHPAFKLSGSPYIIFLAFVILALGCLVVFIVVGRFLELIQRRRGAASGIHETDVGRMSAGFAAIILGISNLRKRRLRTGLNAVTLTLLTFSVASFTSVQSGISFYRLPRATEPVYEGALIRDRAWTPMQPSTLRFVESAFGDEALVIPRAWQLSQVQAERAFIEFEALDSGRSAFAHGLVGLTPDEPRVSGIDRYLKAGRFFVEGERDVVILPDVLANVLGVSEQELGSARLRLYGRDYTVIGIIDSEALRGLVDLDGESLTPVDTVTDASKLSSQRNEDPRTSAAAAIETFNHLEPAQTLFLPYERVMEMDGRLYSIALTGFKDLAAVQSSIEDFMTRVALTIFVSDTDQVVAYSSIGSTSVSGAGQLFVPILIAALIVLNTMMGSVYERSREIGVYSVVGLAPSHISMLFLAESTVFATFGGVAGYLLGQISYLGMLYFDIAGITLNYSSLSAVWSTMVVIVTVYLSTLYPARMAADMAVPDVTRQWQFPDPDGDTWRFDFPFTVGGAEVPAIYAYLKIVFDAYGEGSIGDFIARDVQVQVDSSQGDSIYDLKMSAWLSPYDLGISQTVHLRALSTGEHNIYRIEMDLQRVSGDVASWVRMNRNFLHVLRKRFLVWRTLPQALRDDYRDRSQAVLSAGQLEPESV